MEKERNIIVGVGSIRLSTTDGENHTIVAGGKEITLNTLELDILHEAVCKYLIKQLTGQ